MAAMMQAFYWDCPREEHCEGQWWNHVRTKIAGLTHEGFPCVFWQNFYNRGLAMENTPHGIAALVQAHHQYAGGGTQVLSVDDDLYVMQRGGHAEQPGLIYV